MTVSKEHEAQGWKYRWGPNGQDGAHHAATDWLIQAAGAHSPYLIWSPYVFGPDDNSTCKYRKAWPINRPYTEGRPELFETIGEAIEFWTNNHLSELYPLPSSSSACDNVNVSNRTRSE